MSELSLSPECEAARPELNALVDGELVPVKRTLIEQHLDDCAACRAEVDLLRLVTQSLRLVPRPEPSVAMWQRLLEQVRADLPLRRMEVFSVERHGDHVIQSREVQIAREPGAGSRLRLAPTVPAGPVIQQFRRVLTDRPNCHQVIEGYHERHYHE